MSSEIREVDIAIIGGGTTGLSAAYHAAAAGRRTVLFEQYEFGNSRASSDGDSRMFRVMYSDATMARLAEAALAQWHEIEASEYMTRNMRESPSELARELPNSYCSKSTVRRPAAAA